MGAAVVVAPRVALTADEKAHNTALNEKSEDERNASKGEKFAFVNRLGQFRLVDNRRRYTCHCIYMSTSQTVKVLLCSAIFLCPSLHERPLEA